MNDKELFDTKASLTNVDFNVKRESGKQSFIKERKLMTFEDFQQALKDRDGQGVCKNCEDISCLVDKKRFCNSKKSFCGGNLIQDENKDGCNHFQEKTN